jgi:hypothetical protein
MKNGTSPTANEPFYQVPTPNRDMTVLSGKMQFTVQGRDRIEGDGSLIFRWLPRPSLRFQVTQSSASTGIPLGEASLDVPSAGLTGVCACIESWTFSSDRMETSLMGAVDDFSLGADGAILKQLLFDIPNFHEYDGSWIARRNGGSLGRLTLETTDWFIHLDATADLGERIRALRSHGGFLVTHAGALARKDGEPFGFADTAEIRNALSTWLSFSRGLRCSPVFWHSNSHAWTRYVQPILSPWRCVLSWFPFGLACNRTAGIFPRLVLLLADPIWKRPLELAIYWYIHANECAGGVEGSIILAQSELETLAWTYLVEDAGVVTRQVCDGLTAVERIERLLAEMGIPAVLPSSGCPKLSAWAQLTGRARSGPDALVGLRNALIHPTTKNLSKALAVPSSAMAEAWQLSLVYLETVILALLGYDGPVYSRLLRGVSPEEAEVPKPWVPT